MQIRRMNYFWIIEEVMYKRGRFPIRETAFLFTRKFLWNFLVNKRHYVSIMRSAIFFIKIFFYKKYLIFLKVLSIIQLNNYLIV